MTTINPGAGQPKLQMLLTGNEIMSGDTVDSNSARVAQRLSREGVAVARKVTVGDDFALLVSEIRALAADSDLLLINGGLGPTIDDLTAQALAEAAQLSLAEHPDALQHLEQWCGRRGLPLDAANRKQAVLPAGCDILPNARGSAVGIALSMGKCRVYCTPGVPGELTTMLEAVVADIRARFPNLPGLDILRLQTFGLGESTAQQLLADAIPNWPQAVHLGFRAGAPQMEIKLAIDSAAAAQQRAQVLQTMQDLFGDHIIGEGDATLAACTLELLRAGGARLATAESCTGGLIASMLTQVPGASAAFEAGFVTYSNAMKQSLLDVRAATLAEQGAVSEAVVREMAAGALAHSCADYAIAVSGVAGPDGGTPDKPVGTVWLAWGPADALEACGVCWPVERTLFQTMVAAAGLDLVRRRLLGINSLPRYLEQRRIQAP